MDPIEAIAFDLDHTLAIDNRLERVAFLRLLETVLNEGATTRGTLGEEIDAIDALLASQRRGDLPIDEAVRRFVQGHGIEPSAQHVEGFRRTAVAMVGEFVVPLPGVRATLHAFAERGVTMAILSNGWNPLQTAKAERTGFRGPILVSSEIGEQKPAPQAFEALLQRLGTDPARTWYVGDDPRGDVGGAHAMGMRAVWINWEGKEYPAAQRRPDRTIQAFGELLDLFASKEHEP